MTFKKNNQSENHHILFSDPAIIEVVSSVSSFKNHSSMIDPEPSVSNMPLTGSNKCGASNLSSSTSDAGMDQIPRRL